MSVCNIYHSSEDVVEKLNSQGAFLPKALFEQSQQFLKEEHSHEVLNELFHLLKKYDLRSEPEQEERNTKISMRLK